MTSSSTKSRGLRTAALAEFLKARREELTPEQFGLTNHERRRVAGLRREEVAHLAGVSTAWYTRLEQGADVRPTTSVIDAIARAMCLDYDGHCYLRRLAHLPDDVEPESDSVGWDDIHELVDQFMPSPAFVVDEFYDFVAWNAGYAEFVGISPDDLPEDRRNLLWLTFANLSTDRLVDGWDRMAAAMIAHFRWNSVARIDDPRLAKLVADLTAESPEFSKYWARAAVSRHAVPPITVDHPEAGLIRLRETLELRIQGHRAFLKVKLPASAEDRRRLVALLGDAG